MMNIDFLNEVTICNEVNHQVSPSDMEKVFRDYLIVFIRGILSCCNKETPKCDGSFFSLGKQLSSIQASSCPGWLDSSGLFLGILAAYVLESGWLSFLVGQKGEKKGWRRDVCCFKGSSMECTHHFHSHSIGKNLVPWPPNCWATTYSGSSLMVEEGEKTF